MNYIDKDIVDHEDYIEFTTFNKFNIKNLFLLKNIMEVFLKEVKKMLLKTFL